MLQRPQTLFLLGVFILCLLMLTGPLTLFSLDGSEYVLKHSGLFDPGGEKMAVATWPLSVFFILLALLSFLNIFFYRHRIRQMRISIYLILLNAGMVGMMFYYTGVAKVRLDGALVLHHGVLSFLRSTWFSSILHSGGSKGTN